MIANGPGGDPNSSDHAGFGSSGPAYAAVRRPVNSIVTVILIAFNSGLVLKRALDSIPPGLEIIVVDNNSSDNSVAIAKSLNCVVIENSSNVGFGKACNQASRLTTSEFLFFLNPDVVLAPGALEGLLAEHHKHIDGAAFGPKLLPLGSMETRCNGDVEALPTDAFISDVGREDVATSPALSGAAMLCRRNAFEAVGGFDERFFLYFEDADLCIRLKDNGGTLVQFDEFHAFHNAGNSSHLSNLIYSPLRGI